MKFFDPLLGFAVLTGPLWLIVVMVPVAIWIAITAAKRVRRKGAKLPVGLGVFALVFVLLFADEIVGRVYLNYLCATQAGVKVYQTVELPAEYWDEQGKAKFLNEYDNLVHNFAVKIIDRTGGHTERYSSFFYIEKGTSPIKEKASTKLLAEVTNFRYWGGWMRRNLTPNNTANSCEFMDAPDFRRSFYSRLFKSATSSK